jgi:hypothetical protein
MRSFRLVVVTLAIGQKLTLIQTNRQFPICLQFALLTLPKALVAEHLTIIIIDILLQNVDIEKLTTNYQEVTSMWLVPLINAYIALLKVI